MQFRWARVLVLVAPLLLAGGCVVNPVTGQNEIGWVSTDQQIEIGRKNYVPAQQMQGGQYKVDRGLTTYVNEVGQKVAARAPIDLPWEFVVLNNSVPNAWAMPGGKIAVNRGLLTELGSEAELAAVLGHEVVHAAARHGAQNMERSMLLQGAMIAAVIGTRNQEYAGAVLGGAQLAAGLITQKYGRDAERESDRVIAEQEDRPHDAEHDRVGQHRRDQRPHAAARHGYPAAIAGQSVEVREHRIRRARAEVRTEHRVETYRTPQHRVLEALVDLVVDIHADEA